MSLTVFALALPALLGPAGCAADVEEKGKVRVCVVVILATEKDGAPKQWDPADIGRILNRYHFGSENPGIDAQRRA